MPTGAAVRAQPLGDLVYGRILEWIMDGTLEPGTPLRLQKLIAELEVSQTPVREALSRLEGQGLAVREPMKGYTVAPPLDATDVDKLMGARLLLEPRIAASAARLGSKEQRNALLENVVRSRGIAVGQTFPEYQQYMNLSAEFHELLGKAANDRFLVAALEALPVHLQRFRLFGSTGVDDVDVSLSEHESVAHAVGEQDEDAAFRAMEAHITGVAQRSKTR
jgi:DNA-binding GntR family transcriptional regulator